MFYQVKRSTSITTREAGWPCQYFPQPGPGLITACLLSIISINPPGSQCKNHTLPTSVELVLRRESNHHNYSLQPHVLSVLHFRRISTETRMLERQLFHLESSIVFCFPFKVKVSIPTKPPNKCLCISNLRSFSIQLNVENTTFLNIFNIVS